MEVNFENYKEMAMRTAKMPESEHDGLLHAAVGMGSEVGELAITVARHDWLQHIDVENTIEEVGDVMWYIALLCAVLEIDMLHDLSGFDNDTAVIEFENRPPKMLPVKKLSHKHQMLSYYCGELITLIKAHCYYGKELPKEKIRFVAAHAVRFCSEICEFFGYQIESAMLANIVKLRKRYPEKFTEKDAISRADKV
ncbi:MAG TPA: hypothetical protein VFM18_09335 [Methanosarcina sp.]|nr:hypothetical protein [Methanosarcina sp.]